MIQSIGKVIRISWIPIPVTTVVSLRTFLHVSNFIDNDPASTNLFILRFFGIGKPEFPE